MRFCCLSGTPPLSRLLSQFNHTKNYVVTFQVNVNTLFTKEGKSMKTWIHESMVANCTCISTRILGFTASYVHPSRGF